MRAVPHALIGTAAAKTVVAGLTGAHVLQAGPPVEVVPLYLGAIVGSIVLDADHPLSPAGRLTGGKALPPGMGGGVSYWNGQRRMYGRQLGPFVLWHGALGSLAVGALLTFVLLWLVGQWSHSGFGGWLTQVYGPHWALLTVLGFGVAVLAHIAVDRLNPVRAGSWANVPVQVAASMVAFWVLFPGMLQFGHYS